MSWTDQRIVAFDTETTGLNPFDGDRVMEFGAVEITVDSEYRITGVSAHDWLINPEMPIPREVTRVTGIKDEDVLGKPVFSKVAKDIHKVLDGAMVVAHNLAFDLNFLKLEFERCGMHWPLTVAEVDTLHISRAKMTDQHKHNLGHICGLFGVPLDNAHRATDDAEACGRVLVEFARRYAAPQDLSGMIVWADAVGPPPDTGHIALGDGGAPYFLEGEHQGARVDQHPDHLQWMTMALVRVNDEWQTRYPPELHEWIRRWLRARASGRFRASPRGGGPKDWGLDPAPWRAS
jgi:DNA polymerase III epsilon subunit family exonuclease